MNMDFQNGQEIEIMITMGEQYFRGVLAGYLGANFMCGTITEWQIDVIKERVFYWRKR